MKLVVIGNGFDCAHGLNTKYASFREFIKKSDADEYNFLKQLFGANFEMDEFWYNFEESLARYNLNNFVQDLEKITLNNKIKHFDDAKCEEIIKNSFKEYIYKLKKLFCLWIKKINDEDLKNIKKKDNISKYLENSIILTFNYTSIIEDLYKKTCYHMHGCIKDLNLDKESELGNIILGHSYEISFVTDDDEILNADDAMLIVDDDQKIPIYLCTFNKEFGSSKNEVVNNSLSEIDREFESTFTKRCLKVIDEDITGFFEYLKNNSCIIDSIVILGHSLSNIDKMYFDKIFEILKKDDKKIKWIVSYYKNNIDILSQNLKMIDANAEPIFIDINNC